MAINTTKQSGYVSYYTTGLMTVKQTGFATLYALGLLVVKQTGYATLYPKPPEHSRRRIAIIN